MKTLKSKRKGPIDKGKNKQAKAGSTTLGGQNSLMKLLIWNVRGLNNLLKQKEVVRRIRNLNISLVCLLETRVKHNNMQEIINKMFSRWKFLHNYNYASNGRI